MPPEMDAPQRTLEVDKVGTGSLVFGRLFDRVGTGALIPLTIPLFLVVRRERALPLP